MTSAEIRQKFFDFFKKQGHTSVPSSSLIPAQDPTLLFANAGMNQFKDVFLGKEKRSYTRAVSIQKCVRAGGKHNDLENVGFTKRHLTFFEMMGNFSFDDYFKKEAIRFAWDFLTKELKLATENLHATVYTTDDESYAIWHKEIGIPAQRMHRLGEKDNFWQMGETGPCGPCTEIHIDRGPAFGCADSTTCGPACDCDRFLEIWNIVFMQFDRQPDGTDKPLAKTGVDTGMGLERLCSIIQNKDSVYQTDIFTPIIARIEKLTGIPYAQQNDQHKAAFHVLADHIRSATMIIADGGSPSNEGRGYVLRKIIRRAALFSQKLTDDTIFPELSRVVIEQLGQIYPELTNQATLIYKILESEVSKFAHNLTRGHALLEKYFKEHAAQKIVTGAQAFKLYDTYGFPIELVRAMAYDNHFSVDNIAFEHEMAKQQEQSGKKPKADELTFLVPDAVTTEFTGYDELITSSPITHLIHKDTLAQKVAAGETCWIITKQSPFFIVGGGQMPDQGTITIEGKETPLLEIRYINNAIGARIKTPVDLTIGKTVTCIVDQVWRTNAMKNHTATHLLQAALIELFGHQIKQSGSLVHPDYLRFDFTYHENLSSADLQKVEDLVNKKIQENMPVIIEYMPLSEAQKKGALAFFGDKYNPEKVRVIQIADFSIELCGGTHVRATGDIGLFKITEMGALSAGHRRITAVTGPAALALFQETFAIVRSLSHDFKVPRENVLTVIEKEKEANKQLHHTYKQLKKKLYALSIPQWIAHAERINGITFLYQDVMGASIEELRDIAQECMQQKVGFIFITSTSDTKTSFVAALNKSVPHKDIKTLAQLLQQTYGIRCGGSATLIQGGMHQIPSTLIKDLKEWLTQK